MSQAVAQSLENTLLIAMPGMADPMFSRAVVFVCEHTEEGAMGIVINRPSQYQANEVVEQLGDVDCSPRFANSTVYVGGPVQTDRGFILHANQGRHYDTTITVSDAIALSASVDLLFELARDEGPQPYLLALGYSGWSPGQLEQEISHNSWLHCPADPELIFNTPTEQRWQRAAEKLGIDIHLLASDAGHA